jgi:hypothetical protein
MKPVNPGNQVIDTASAERNDGTRKPYDNPRLIVHGTLQEITNNVGAGFLDFPQGSSIAG